MRKLVIAFCLIPALVFGAANLLGSASSITWIGHLAQFGAAPAATNAYKSIRLVAGSSQYLTATNGTFFDVQPNAFSVVMWVNPSDTITNGIPEQQFLWSKIQVEGSPYSIWQCYFSADGKLHHNKWGNSGSQNDDIATTNATWPAGQWIHIVWTAQTNSMKLYVNGVLCGENTSSLWPVGGTARDFHFGAQGYQGEKAFFSGKIDGPQVCYVALSQSEISWMYSTTNRATNGVMLDLRVSNVDTGSTVSIITDYSGSNTTFKGMNNPTAADSIFPSN